MRMFVMEDGNRNYRRKNLVGGDTRIHEGVAVPFS